MLQVTCKHEGVMDLCDDDDDHHHHRYWKNTTINATSQWNISGIFFCRRIILDVIFGVPSTCGFRSLG